MVLLEKNGSWDLEVVSGKRAGKRLAARMLKYTRDSENFCLNDIATLSDLLKDKLLDLFILPSKNSVFIGKFSLRQVQLALLQILVDNNDDSVFGRKFRPEG
jgi:hypothetical protein